jgi:nucleoside-diphosphate-sugar epimerase
LRSDPPFEFVIHTASPFTQHFSDAITDVLDPAIKGTVELLHAIKSHAPTVRRVVVLSSFAAIINPRNELKGSLIDETWWNPITWDEAVANPRATYAGSKKLAEKAAWDFINSEKPSFDLITLNPPLVFGPIIAGQGSQLNASNQRVGDLIKGKLRDAGSLPPTGVFLWVDVRDLALAHVRAIETWPEAGGQRFIIAAGNFSNKGIVDVLRETHTELGSLLPEGPIDDTPADVYRCDCGKAFGALGMTSYRSFRDSIGDTADSIMGKADHLSLR